MPYINIAIDAFGFLVVLILFVSCLNERIVKKRGPINFLMLLGFIMLSLLADALSWIGDGRVELSMLTAVSSAVCIGSGYCAIIFFMRYLKNNLYADSVGASVTVGIFTFLCVVALAAVVGNLFYGYAYIIDDQGYYVQVSGWGMAVLYLLFPVLATIAIILITLFAKRSTRISKGAFIIYTLFPLVGVIIDSTVQYYSVTYVSFAISALIMYTSIYREKQKLIDEQKNALMLSQINPHFMYTRQGDVYFHDEFYHIDGDIWEQGGYIIETNEGDPTLDTDSVRDGYISITPLISGRTNMTVFEEIKGIK